MTRKTVIMVAGALLVALGCAGRVRAANDITIVEGSSTTVETPFNATKFDVVDKNVVAVRLLPDGQVSLQGLSGGLTSVTVLGEGGGSETFRVRVSPNLDDVVGLLQLALDDVPEVDIVAKSGSVVIRGKVASLSHWNKIQRAVGACAGAKIVDLTELTMPPEILVQLKEGLEKVGFKVAAAGDTVGEETPGVLELSAKGHVVYLTGTVFNTEDLKRILTTVEAQAWFEVCARSKEQKEDTKSDSNSCSQCADDKGAHKYHAVLNVSILSKTLEVDVAFIGVTREQSKKVGMNLLNAGLLSVEAAAALAGDAASNWDKDESWSENDGVRSPKTVAENDSKLRTYNQSAAYAVAKELTGTLQFFTREVPARNVQRAQLHFRNGVPDWSSFQSGGTLKVRLTSEREASLEDIDYGLILKTRGHLVGPQDVDLDVGFELSTPELVPGTSDYNLKRERVDVPVRCPLGKTMILAGLDRLIENRDESATPYLRSIPVLNWLFSEKAERLENRRTLILLSVHYPGEPQTSTRLSAEAPLTAEDAAKPVGERVKEKRKRRFFFF